MTARTASVAEPTAALDAFLRGIERRGFVLAEAQCGDGSRARTATAAAAYSFRAHARGLPLSDWAPLYWQVLLSQPVLRQAGPRSAHGALAQLSSGPRAALLLRLVAGVDEAQGADVLRVSTEAYRHALHSALQSLHDQGIDETSLLTLRDQLQAQANSSVLKPATLKSAFAKPAPTQTSARGSAPTLQPVSSVALASANTGDDTSRLPRWLRPALIALLAMLLLYFGSTFWKPRFLLPAPIAPGQFENLRQQAPAQTLSADAAALSGADFELLNDVDGERMARDLDLYSWYAANPDATATGTDAATALPESSTHETGTPEPDTDPTEDGSAP